MFLPIVVLVWTIVGPVESTEVYYDHHIQVNSKIGHDNSSCLTNNSFPCKTLGFVLEHLNSSTKVSIMNGQYSLNRTYNASKLENVAFVGLGDSVNINCSNDSGLQFRFCNNTVLKHLVFQGCGHLEYSAPFHAQPNDSKSNHQIPQFYAGISFTYCKDLAVENCIFRNSPGVSLVLYDVRGNISIIDSQFVDSRAENQSSSLDVHETAGGILLHLTRFGSLYPFNDTQHSQYSDGNNYIFRGCVFARNEYAHNGSQEIPQPFGHGAGLTAFLCGSAKNNSLLVDSCHFYNNTGIWGGGIFTEFQDKAEGNALKIVDSEFIGNLAKYGGGAVRTGNAVKGNEKYKTLYPPMENTVEHKRNHFKDNHAAMGGAVSHYGRTYPHIYGKYKNSIHFENCSFYNNKATMGSAISVVLKNKNNWIEMGPEIPYCIVIANCTIVHNIVKDEKVVQGHIIGMGVVYSSRVPMILRGENTFEDNLNTALLLDNAPLKVFDQTFFTGNNGNKGGALALYGETRLIMTYGSRIDFSRNNASQFGGAIFIQAPGPDVGPFKTRELRRHECSIAYENEEGNLVDIEKVDEWNTFLNFTDNSAPSWGGNSVYASTLQSCFLPNEGIGNNFAFAWKNIIKFSAPLNEEISTNPVCVVVHKNEWSVAPGEVFDPTVQLLDERNSPVYGVVKITIGNDGSNRSIDSLFLIQFDKNLTNTSKIKGLKLSGRENTNFRVTITSVQGQTISTSFEQRFMHCYDGFEQLTNQDFCSCMQENVDMQEGVYNCSSDGKHVNLITGYWGGRVKGKFVTYPCPQHYCNFDESKYVYSYNNSSMCAGNRCNKAPLCGKCKRHFTVSLGGENCVEASNCKNNFKVSWGIPVFIVVTPIVVLILLRINVDIFTSYLNSWLYFYQVLPFVLKHETTMKLDSGMKAILDLASWRLPEVKLSCFVKKLDNIGKLGLNYLLPLYMLVILIVITLVARCSCNCYQRTNVFRAISTILVLCYTNLTLISFHALRWVKLQKDFSVLYIEGSITDEDVPSNYYALLVFAVIVIIFFSVAFPIFLLFRPFFIKNCRFMTYFTPLYNIFQHCFQDHLGYFSAYYFICRIALLVLTAALATPGPYHRCFTEILVFLTLVIFVYVQPYKTDSHLKWLNTVDTVILSLLCIMAFMSTAQNTEAAPNTIKGAQIFIEIFAWLPMLYLVGLIIIAIRYYFWSCPPTPRHGYQDLDDPTSTSGT